MIEWPPTASELVVKLAVPPDTVPVPSVVAPSVNVTVPVGVPGEVELTVAVNVTVWPKTLGLAEDANAVVVEPGAACASAGLPENRINNATASTAARDDSCFHKCRADPAATALPID